jgi:hypothetical protein
MTGPVALPPPPRVSDAERDHALRVLRDSVAVGRLSDESFEWRVEEVLRVRSRDELAMLVEDLPTGTAVADWAERAAQSFSSLFGRVRHAARPPRVERLGLPRDSSRTHTLGRHPDADLVLSHPTVSRWHARLRFDQADGWLLTDLASTNGTWLNGWRIASTQVVCPGDRVAFGLVSVVLSAPRGPLHR